MLCYIKFIFFILSIAGFGFISLSQITKIKSLIFLIPSSFSFGIAAYLFICHILSFLTGPQTASIISLFILLAFSLIILVLKYKTLYKIEAEITNLQLISIICIGTIISILSFLAMYRFGPFDNEFHIQLASTLFHNNIYPPRDFYRPEYVLLYHFGGDLLAGAISHICGTSISRGFELMSFIFSGVTFLSLFSVAWILTKNFNLSLIGSFCTYFSGGLLWLDAIIRYVSNNLPSSSYKWSFLETFFNVGIHGAITDGPWIFTLLSTAGIGTPVLIFSLILFWKMIEENNLKAYISHIIFLLVSLFTLFLSAEWLYMTFLGAVIPFLLFLVVKKQKQFLIPIVVLLTLSVILNKTLGNTLFLQDTIQSLGRANIFNIGIKKSLLHVMSWGRLSKNIMDYKEISSFSWDFISEFGLSFFLFPISIIYLIKTKNKFAFLLFLTAITTIPLPVILDFKLNPVDANRLFSFGNSMLVLLITCGIGVLFNQFFQNKTLLITYLTAFCLSPVSGLVSSAVFTPYIFSSKSYVKEIFDNFKRVKSLDDLKIYFVRLDKLVRAIKNRDTSNYEKEIQFLSLNSKPKDVAISSLTDVPAYAGVYTLIPAGKWLYKDLIYSFYDSIYLSTLTTLDPYLLDELNIKWIFLSNNSKNNLPKETQGILSNTELCKLIYSRDDKSYEIYHVNETKNLLSNFSRKTAWTLVNSKGQPIELVALEPIKITLFPSLKSALLYLKLLQTIKPELKKELVTAQVVVIDSLEKQIKSNNLVIKLDKKF